MDVALLLARLALVAVFVAAAVSKAVDWVRWRQAVRDFGLTPPAVAVVGVAVPVFEVAVAAALTTHRFAWWGAVGAVVLLGAFSAAIATAVARGRTPDCRCFGRRGGGPVSTRTLVRNALIAVPAVAVVVAGTDDPGPSFTNLHSDAVVAVGLATPLAVVVASWFFLLELLRQHGRLLLRIEALEAGRPPAVGRQTIATASWDSGRGLPVGTAVPDLMFRDLHGRRLPLRRLLRNDRPVLVAFAEPDCGPCAALIPALARAVADRPERLAVAVVSTASARAVREAWGGLPLSALLVDDAQAASTALSVGETPAAMLISDDGRVAARLVSGAAAISELVADVLAQSHDAAHSRVPAEALP